MQHLTKLLGLNLNNNCIEEIIYEKLPKRIQLISFKNNPVNLDANYKSTILKNLKQLQMLDDQNITQEDKFKALGIFPPHLLAYATQMKQFRNKQLIKKQINENKPLYLGDNINQKQILNELRTQTNKYLQQNHKEFQVQIKDQMDNFQQRIKVSKKIRDIKAKQQAHRISQLKEDQVIKQQQQEHENEFIT